jgi:predicted nucleic acid-binding protein
MKPRVFVDASAYVALLRKDDANHAAAAAIYGTLQQQQAHFVTTYFVVAEAHALLLRYLGIPSARRFLQNLDTSQITTLAHVAPDDITAAKALLYRYADKDFSLADAISFTVMTRLGLQTAFTFDGHFQQYGLRVL